MYECEQHINESMHDLDEACRMRVISLDEYRRRRRALFAIYDGQNGSGSGLDSGSDSGFDVDSLIESGADVGTGFGPTHDTRTHRRRTVLARGRDTVRRAVPDTVSHRWEVRDASRSTRSNPGPAIGSSSQDLAGGRRPIATSVVVIGVIALSAALIWWVMWP
ncbi:protein of unknown function [Pararobbsia alpina]|uniref:hypothetical protein n=1 Tax=Pararobbsia alpina TaxID=621374 RepID=UPI0039A73395